MDNNIFLKTYFIRVISIVVFFNMTISKNLFCWNCRVFFCEPLGEISPIKKLLIYLVFMSLGMWLEEQMKLHDNVFGMWQAQKNTFQKKHGMQGAYTKCQNIWRLLFKFWNIQIGAAKPHYFNKLIINIFHHK